MRIEVACKSDIGTREEQQDAYYADFSDNKAFAVVCDGMGGTEGGSAASNAAVKKAKELIASKKSSEAYQNFFFRAIDILDEEIVKLQKNESIREAGTTIVAVAIENENLYWLSVGDSRAYIIRGNEIVRVTRDHNYALSLEQLTIEEAETVRKNEKKHRPDALISFIGIGGVRIYDINSKAFTLIAGDMILLTTDGLTNSLSDNDILNTLLTSPDITNGLDALLQLAAQKANGVQDNTTCVLIKV